MGFKRKRGGSRRFRPRKRFRRGGRIRRFRKRSARRTYTNRKLTRIVKEIKPELKYIIITNTTTLDQFTPMVAAMSGVFICPGLGTSYQQRLGRSWKPVAMDLRVVVKGVVGANSSFAEQYNNGEYGLIIANRGFVAGNSPLTTRGAYYNTNSIAYFSDSRMWLKNQNWPKQYKIFKKWHIGTQKYCQADPGNEVPGSSRKDWYKFRRHFIKFKNITCTQDETDISSLTGTDTLNVKNGLWFYMFGDSTGPPAQGMLWQFKLWYIDD